MVVFDPRFHSDGASMDKTTFHIFSVRLPSDFYYYSTCGYLH